MGLSKRNQLFLQRLMQIRFLTEKNAKLLYLDCLQKVVPQKDISAVTLSTEDLEKEIAKINRVLDLLHMEIRRASYRKKTYWGLVNQKSDEFSKQNTKFKLQDLMFFKTVAEAIMENDTEYIPYTDALMNRNTEKESSSKITQADARALLDTFNEAGWLSVEADPSSNRRGKVVYLGVRSVLELPDVRQWNIRRFRVSSEGKRKHSEIEEEEY